MTDTLSLQGMEPYLREKAAIHIYPSLESTNNTAKAMLNPEHGTVIMADYQTAGRGRHGRSFFSPPGCGIYMSIILHPERFWLDSLALMTPMAAVAVCEAVEATTQKAPQIKWVNDVFLYGKKICGILTEAVTGADGTRYNGGGAACSSTINNHGSETIRTSAAGCDDEAVCAKAANHGETNGICAISYIVVGIGINYITPPCGFPPEISQTAGALLESQATVDICPISEARDVYLHESPERMTFNRLLAPHPQNYNCVTRNQLAAEIINRMLTPGNSTERIITEYKKRLLVLQRRVLVISPDSTYEATALDIDAQCGLIVQKNSGEILTLTAGEVSLHY